MYLLPPVTLWRALTALVALFLCTACDDSSADSAIVADAGSGSDSEVDAGAGSGAGSGALNPCWLEGVPVEKCPVQPRGAPSISENDLPTARATPDSPAPH